MTDPLHVPVGVSRGEHTDRGSRFLSYCLAVEEAPEVSALLKRVRADHNGCSHVVNAWRVGNGGDVFGYSDDGEPKGTAGRPVFEVLKGSGVTNVLIAVVRYFGGTKLGTGGLVRAYTEAAKRAVAGLKTEILTVRLPFSVTVPYPLYEQTKRLLVEREAHMEHEEFGVMVVLTGEIPESSYDEANAGIIDLSAGSVSLLRTDE